MKTCLIILFSLFQFLYLSGQIEISETDLIDENESSIMTLATPGLGFDPVPTGTNYTWDFSSGLTPITLDTINSLSVASTPLAYQLYFNNVFSPDYYSDYAISADDLSGFTQVQITDRYEYFKKSSDALKLVGYGAKISGVPVSVKYDTIDQILPLPLSYGVTDSTTAYYLLSVPAMGTYGQWIRRKVQVDGWGTIKTPVGTYDALRVKTTLYQRDTIYFDSLGFGNTFDRSVEYHYDWYAANEKIPVFSAKVVNMITNEVKYKGSVNNSIAESKHDEPIIFPSPTNDIIHIITGGKHYESLELFNYQGTLIQSRIFTQTLDLKDYPSGIYLLRLINKKATFSSTILKN